jgi:hypothetical protein
MEKSVLNNPIRVLIVTVLINTALAALAVLSASGQNVTLAQSVDCPLNLRFSSPLTRSEKGTGVSLEAQNTGVKSVYAYDLLVRLQDKTEQIVPVFFHDYLQSGDTKTATFTLVDNLNLMKDRYDGASIRIDQILFSDGTSWGPDSQKQWIVLRGSYEGRRMAVRDLKEMARSGDLDRLSEMMTAELESIVIRIPLTNNQTEYREGFNSGYKGLLRAVRSQKPNNQEELAATINSLAD